MRITDRKTRTTSKTREGTTVQLTIQRIGTSNVIDSNENGTTVSRAVRKSNLFAIRSLVLQCLNSQIGNHGGWLGCCWLGFRLDHLSFGLLRRNRGQRLRVRLFLLLARVQGELSSTKNTTGERVSTNQNNVSCLPSLNFHGTP